MKSLNVNTDARPLKVALLVNWGLGLEILRFLYGRRGVEVVLVVTQWREGREDPWFNAVFDLAKKLGVKAIPQSSLTMVLFKEHLSKVDPDLMIVHAYMHRLPADLFQIPRLGCINIHTSLLPKYRGPSPVYWALRNREPYTGLTSHYMDEGLDTGDIIHQVRFPLETEDRIDTVLEKQKIYLGELLEETIRKLNDPGFCSRAQDNSLASYAPRPENIRMISYV
jgi:methionyl-tRNA formyltransferase